MQKDHIPQNRQINLQPGIWQLARALENGGLSEKRLCELRGMMRVLSGLAACIHGDFESDDQVLEKEFNHLVSDVHEESHHPDEAHHNQVIADLSGMVTTMLNMADDNVIAVSRVDCSRVFASSLECAEEILGMHKPPTSYRDEAMGMIDTVCDLISSDSYFPDIDIELAKELKKHLKQGDVRGIIALRRHLRKIGG